MVNAAIALAIFAVLPPIRLVRACGYPVGNPWEPSMITRGWVATHRAQPGTAGRKLGPPD